MNFYIEAINKQNTLNPHQNVFWFRFNSGWKKNVGYEFRMDESLKQICIHKKILARSGFGTLNFDF